MCFDNNSNININSGNTKERKKKLWLNRRTIYVLQIIDVHYRRANGAILFIALCYFRFPMYKFTLVVCPRVIDRLVVVMHLELRQPVYHDPIEVIYNLYKN